jgi:hypothetical protein
MAVCLSFSDIVEGKSTQLSLKVAAGKSIDTVKDNRDTNLINKRTMPSNFGGKEKSFSQCSTVRTHDPGQRTIEILPECVGDFTVLHFLPVFDFIPHFYQLFLVSCLFNSYVHLADDHVNNVSYFSFMSIKKVFCVLREGYYVIIWLIVRICVSIKD